MNHVNKTVENIFNRLSNISLIFLIVLFGMIHFGHNELVVNSHLIQFGKKLVDFKVQNFN